MTAIYIDSGMSGEERRRALYEGAIFVFSPRPSTMALCELARELCEEAFAPHDPRTAQQHMPVEDYVEVLRELKPNFIHHPRCKEIIPDIFRELGADLNTNYFDVPRLRTVTSDGYLTSGLGYAFKPHRDTWYSPPMCQLNWWLPVYEIEPNNSMAFHTQYWNRKLKNSSEEFNYQDWQQTGRKAAPGLVQKDTRRQSEALEPVETEPQLRLVAEPGGLIVFSAAHMHSTVANTSGVTRFSIDFRTVNLDDLRNDEGAPNLDSACSGTTIDDYLSAIDAQQLPDELRDQIKQQTAPAAT